MSSQQTTSSALSTDGLTKQFGSRMVVDHINLEVERGDVFGFLGPNGAGKTTTIRMLLGLIKPTAGSIKLFGQVQTGHASSIFYRIGAMIELPTFYPYLSGRDNLRLMATAAGLFSRREREYAIDRVLDLVDLRDREQEQFCKYSLGMKQRLGIANALLADPDLVLLDEPGNGLDPAGILEVRNMIKRFAATGKTVFISSHILHEMQQVCNRVAIIAHGRILTQDTLASIMQHKEKLIIRMETQEEAQRVYALLQLLPLEGEISHTASVCLEPNSRDVPDVVIAVPRTKASFISRTLAEQQLFPMELQIATDTLENVFMELTHRSSLVPC